MALTAIIPAAGKGTRMGSPVEGKELMIDPISGRPLIDYAILAAEDVGATRIVVAIEQGTKPQLQEYIRATFPQVYIHLGKQEGEWPSTVLQTIDHWDDHDNVLILPDTRYNVQELHHLVTKHADTSDHITYALLPGNVMEPEKYGVVYLHEVSDQPLWTEEKPQDVNWPNIAAWGLIAFNKQRGQELMEAYTVRGRTYPLSTLSVGTMYLSWFKDITRNGYVETY